MGFNSAFKGLKCLDSADTKPTYQSTNTARSAARYRHTCRHAKAKYFTFRQFCAIFVLFICVVKNITTLRSNLQVDEFDIGDVTVRIAFTKAATAVYITTHHVHQSVQ